MVSEGGRAGRQQRAIQYRPDVCAGQLRPAGYGAGVRLDTKGGDRRLGGSATERGADVSRWDWHGGRFAAVALLAGAGGSAGKCESQGGVAGILSAGRLPFTVFTYRGAGVVYVANCQTKRNALSKCTS